MSMSRLLWTEWQLGFTGFPNIIKAGLLRFISVIMNGNITEKNYSS